ncbi:hypothetical protein JQN58_02255 [Aneurinibacillus sp. BA2021]|nr:hypothetical protein [Aneurinibacillus sp. BA2021]
MWIGSIKWNIAFAGIVSILTFLFSFMNNLLLESLLRSLLAFLLFFMLMYVFRFFTGKIIGKQHDGIVSEKRGQHIDLVTPEESAHQQSEGSDRGSKPNDSGFSEFAPADFPTIARTDKESMDPEEVARALRVFSNE